jgi:hypothetical protein
MASFLTRCVDGLTTVARLYDQSAMASDSPRRRQFQFDRAAAIRADAATLSDMAERLATRQPKREPESGRALEQESMRTQALKGGEGEA